MKLLIACLHHASCTGRFLFDAFARLGHDVRHIGYNGNTEKNIAGWIPQGDFDHYWTNWTPDLLIYAETAFKPWQHGMYFDAPHVNVCSCNNVVNLRDAPPLDLNVKYDFFLAHRDSEVWPVKEENEHWLPCAHDPTFHTPATVPFDERPYDITLIGSGYPMRKEWLDAFEKAGFKVQRGHKYGHDYVIAYHNSKISLCISPYKSPMMRFFETAAMGCLVMGDFCPEFHDLNPVAKGMLFPKTIREALMMAEYFITHPSQAESMIKLSTTWAQRHSWDARAQQIIDWYEKEYSA